MTEWALIDEETGVEHTVRSWCKRCFPEGPEPPPMIVSPQGVAHRESSFGQTECGKDATGDTWTWRL